MSEQQIDVYLVTAHFDQYESTLIGVAGTLDGAKEAALAWVQDREQESEALEWWQLSNEVWQTSERVPVVDHLTIEGWQFVERLKANP
jgi:hypothetical protein